MLGSQYTPLQVVMGLQVLGMAVAALCGGWALGRRSKGDDRTRVDMGAEVLEGLIFTVGLGLSGMLQP